MSNKKKGQKKNLTFSNYLGLLVIIISLLTIALIYFINILPFKYFIVLVIMILIINIICLSLLKSKGGIRNVLGCILTILIIIGEIIGINYELNTLDFFKQFGFNNYKTEHYNVIVLKDSNYASLDDLEGKVVGHLSTMDNPGLAKMITKLDNKVSTKKETFLDIIDLAEGLTSEKITAIILEDAQKQIIEEEHPKLYQEFKVIFSNEIEIPIKDIAKKVNVLQDSYNIYISGVDSYGGINKVSRSDVNIIATINPQTNKILLTSIPRDYYVTLPKYNEKDKLTHASIYGMETSVEAVENLLDIEINYYVKVNFTSLIKIVDALNGIEVDSKYAFTSKDGYYFKKGINKLNGKEALSFVRERKAFQDGDRIRGENQELVLAALIEKVMAPDIIVKYNELLKALENSFITNISESDITNFIKEQIKTNDAWNIDAIVLNGQDTYNYTYSYKKQKLYVMEPDLETVEMAKNMIAELMK